MSWCNSNWEGMPSVMEPSFMVQYLYTGDLTWRKSHQEQQLRKDYLLKLYQDLAQSFPKMF